jgi:hypothetical protein
MSGNTMTRRVMLGQCATAALVLASGCGGDDGGGDSAAGSDSGTTTPTTGASDPDTSGASMPPDTGLPGDSGDTAGDTTSGSSSGGPADGTTDTGGGSTGDTGAASACDAMIVAAISGNHGHALEIPLADIEAGVEVVYDATGEAGHCHEVILTAEDFATLRDGGVVTKFSCNGGDHQFVLSCAPGAPAPVDPPRCGGNGDNTGACN